MKKYNLLFMGDSITAGVYSDGIMDYTRKGYDDFIKEEYKKRGQLASFYNVAVSGFTTKDMLKMLKQDLTYNENVAYNITPERTYHKGNYKKQNTAKLLKEDIEIKTLIQNADIIIMTIGSNDIIKYMTTHRNDLKENFDIKKIVDKNEELGLKTSILKSLLDTYKKIFNHLYEINENVKIVLVGSYTPNKSDLFNKVLFKSLESLEVEILSEVQKNFKNLKILPIRKDIKKYKKISLDNPLNIHLTEDGYKIIANKYIKEMMN